MTEIFDRIAQEIPKLRRYARALMRDPAASDDLVQDALTRALSKAHLWQEGTDLRAWLFTILHNQYVNQVRRGVREGISVVLSETETRLTAGPSQQARLQLRDLDRALAKLPAEQRDVILLAGIDGLSYEEMAAIMEVPVGTVRSRLSRGRDALRTMMGEERSIAKQAEPAARAVRQYRPRAGASFEQASAA
jgi:RNA polymerase sigma-70 factor (ECF subfamily)